jgi:hypothetical protein
VKQEVWKVHAQMQESPPNQPHVKTKYAHMIWHFPRQLSRQLSLLGVDQTHPDPFQVHQGLWQCHWLLQCLEFILGLMWNYVELCGIRRGIQLSIPCGTLTTIPRVLRGINMWNYVELCGIGCGISQLSIPCGTLTKIPHNSAWFHLQFHVLFHEKKVEFHPLWKGWNYVVLCGILWNKRSYLVDVQQLQHHQSCCHCDPLMMTTDNSNECACLHALLLCIWPMQLLYILHLSIPVKGRWHLLQAKPSIQICDWFLFLGNSTMRLYVYLCRPTSRADIEFCIKLFNTCLNVVKILFVDSYYITVQPITRPPHECVPGSDWHAAESIAEEGRQGRPGLEVQR